MLGSFVALSCWLFFCLVSSVAVESNETIPTFESPSIQEVVPENDIRGLSAEEIIQLRGFKYEVHWTKTSDEYDIYMVRIVNTLIDPKNLKGPIVSLHGLLAGPASLLASSQGVRPFDLSAACNVNEIEQVLANLTGAPNPNFWLANFGWDLWLTSFRGTDVSIQRNRKVTLGQNFWDFSQDEHALLDLPAMFSYIRTTTGHARIGFLGHSQATFAVFALLATRPDYANLIEPIVAIGPLAYFGQASQQLTRALSRIAKSSRHVNGPFPPFARIFRQNFDELCGEESLDGELTGCTLIGRLFGSNLAGSLTGQLPYYSSTKVIRHCSQLAKSNRFAMYDYGWQKNRKVYGQERSPLYSIGRIKSRSLCLVSSRQDELATLADVKRFHTELRVPLFKSIVLDDSIGHYDLIVHPAAMQRTLRVALEALEVSSRGANYAACAQRNETLPAT